MDVERVAVPTPTRAPTGTTNAYVLGRDPAILVDPAERTDALDRLVDERAVETIVPTHTHSDHVGAIEAYVAECDATVLALAGRTGRFADATGIEPDDTFRPGDSLSTGEGTVDVIALPGHASDHVGFETPSGTVVGDCAVAEGSVVVGAPDGDLRAYLTSLRRLYARDPSRLYPGHGPVIDDPRATVERLITHRLDRERRVRCAISEGARTLDEVLAAAYDKDLSGVEDLARATVLAHAEKLAVEGDVRLVDADTDGAIRLDTDGDR